MRTPRRRPRRDSRPAWAPDHLADTVDQLCALSARKLASLRGRGHLFVHVTDQALRTRTGIARVEGLGPIDIPSSPTSSATPTSPSTPSSTSATAAAPTPTSTPRPPRTTSGPRPAATSSPTAPAPPPARTSTSTTTTPTTPPDHPARPAPTTAAPSADDTTAGRPTAATPAAPSDPADTSGRHPTASALLVDHTGTRRLDDDQADLILTAPDRRRDLRPTGPARPRELTRRRRVPVRRASWAGAPPPGARW